MIPPILHQFWLGKQPMPDVYQAYCRKFWRDNPDCECRLWFDDIKPLLSDDNARRAFQTARDPSEQADVLFWHALREKGGIACDVDIQPVKRLTEFLALPAFLCTTPFKGLLAINAHMAGFPPHHFFPKLVCAGMLAQMESGERLGRLPEKIWCSLDIHRASQITIVPTAVTSPYGPDDSPEFKRERWMGTPTTQVIHRFAGSWFHGKSYVEEMP